MSIIQPPAGFPPGGESAVMPQGHQVRVSIIWRDLDTDVPLVSEYVTDKIIGPMSFTRGRPVDAVSVGNLVVGECHFTLHNEGKFAPYNTASPLYAPEIKRSNVSAGRLITIDFYLPTQPGTGVWSRMWTGVVKEIHPRKDGPGQPAVVDIIGAGPLWFFGDTEVKFDGPATQTAGDLAQAIVDAPEFKPSKPLAKLLTAAPWFTVITDWKAEGTGLALLGDLELRQGGHELQETKDGYIELPPDDVDPEWKVMFNDTDGWDKKVTYNKATGEWANAADPNDWVKWGTDNSAGVTRPIFQVRRVEEVNAEPLIFNCFRFAVAPQDSVRPDPADLLANGVLLPKLKFTPTADNGIARNQEKAGEYEFSDDDFAGVVFQPGKTRFKVVWAADFASIDESTAIWMQVDIPGGGPQPDRWREARWKPTTPASVEVDASKPNHKVSWGIQRTARAPGQTAWLLEINFYGIRNLKPDQEADSQYCEKLNSVIRVYGEREFLKAPHFANDAEATRWVSITSARYANEALRLTLTIIPKDKKEMQDLSALDLGEGVLLRLGADSGLWITEATSMIVKRVEWEMDENHVWQAHFDLIDNRFYDKTIVGGVEGGLL